MSNSKITAEQMMAIDREPENRTIQWKGRTITVRPFLSLKETSEFVDSVMTACYDEERKVLFPELLDFAFRINVICRYSMVELPSDIEVQHRIVYMTDLYNIVYRAICQSQVDALWDTIKRCSNIFSSPIRD